MLLVTGGHSMKDIVHAQSQAGLAASSPAVVKDPTQASLALVLLRLLPDWLTALGTGSSCR